MAALTTTSASGAVVTSARLKVQGITGFQGYYAYWRNSTAYNVDFSVKAGTVGHVWWVSAAYSHSGAVSGTYGYYSEGWITRYNGTHQGLFQLHAGGNASVAGSVGWSAPSTSLIRCTKNSGYYPGLGGCVVQINGSL